MSQFDITLKTSHGLQIEKIHNVQNTEKHYHLNCVRQMYDHV